MSYRQNITKHIKLTESIMLTKKQKKKTKQQNLQLFLKKKKDLRFKVALSGLRQFLATDSTFKIMKNAVYFTLKALFFQDNTFLCYVCL